MTIDETMKSVLSKEMRVYRQARADASTKKLGGEMRGHHFHTGVAVGVDRCVKMAVLREWGTRGAQLYRLWLAEVDQAAVEARGVFETVEERYR